MNVMELRKRPLGAEHLDTLRCIANLIITYYIEEIIDSKKRM